MEQHELPIIAEKHPPRRSSATLKQEKQPATPSGLVSREKVPECNEAVTSKQLFVIIGSLYLGTLLVALDTTIIGTAIPAITSDFHSLNDIAWYGSAYLLTLTALQPTFGKLYNIFDTKKLYLASIVLFGGERFIIPSSIHTGF
jgi:hypothetical protein